MTRRAAAGSLRLPYSEQGAIVPIIAVILVAALIILAFVIDLPSEELVAKQLQTASDAAALAAASVLDGTSSGFVNAKKTAVAVLKNEKIKGATLNLASNPSFSLSDGDIYNQTLDGTNYRGTTGHSGNLEIKIERGLYWMKEDGSNYEFISLETATTGKKYGIPLAIFSNAVRVSISISSTETIFAKIFGAGKFGNLSRSSRAVNDSELEREVAPFALRACDLLLDTNPNVMSGDHFTDGYKADIQCGRNSVLFREPNWENAASDNVSVSPPYDVRPEPGTAGTLRREGTARAAAYMRPPLYTKTSSAKDTCFPAGTGTGSYPNCKALPLIGVLGVPGANYEKSPASEVLRVLGGGAVTAKLGQPFRTMNDPRDLWTTATRDSAGHSPNEVLAAWINGSGEMLKTAFYSGTTPKPNFPYLNTPGPIGNVNLYARRFFPDPTNDNYKIPIIMPIYNSSSWTNPMCHADGVAVNNRDTAKVRKSWVPVVAATAKNSKGQEMILCDWKNTFSNTMPDSVPPVAETKPRIIGFMKIDAYDGNFSNLDLEFPPVAAGFRSTPVATDPTTGVKVASNESASLEFSSDKIPGLKKLKEEIQDFGDKHHKYWNCVEDSGDDCDEDRPDAPDLSGLVSDTAWYARCFQFFDRPGQLGIAGLFSLQFKNYADLADKYLEAKKECTGDDPESEVCKIVYKWENGAKDKFDDLFEKMDKLMSGGVQAVPDMHCVPLTKPNMYNLNTGSAWEPMDARNAGEGCGGVAAALDECGTDLNLATGKSKANNKPGLVQ